MLATLCGAEPLCEKQLTPTGLLLLHPREWFFPSAPPKKIFKYRILSHVIVREIWDGWQFKPTPLFTHPSISFIFGLFVLCLFWDFILFHSVIFQSGLRPDPSQTDMNSSNSTSFCFSQRLPHCLSVYWVVFILFRQGRSSHQPVLYFSYIEISTMSASFIWSINTLFIIYHYKVAVDSAPVMNECPPCVGTHISSHSILGPTRFSHTTTWLTSASRSCHHSGCSGVAWSGIPPPAPTAPGTCTKWHWSQ